MVFLWFLVLIVGTSVQAFAHASFWIMSLDLGGTWNMAVLTEEWVHMGRYVWWSSKTNDIGIRKVLQPKGCQKMPQTVFPSLCSPCFQLLLSYPPSWERRQGSGKYRSERWGGRYKEEEEWAQMRGRKRQYFIFFLILFCFLFPPSSFSVIFSFEVVMRRQKGTPIATWPNETLAGSRQRILVQWKTKEKGFSFLFSLLREFHNETSQ